MLKQPLRNKFLSINLFFTVGSTEKLRKQMDDRRKSRVMHQGTLESSLDGHKQRIEDLKKESDENMKEISILKQELLETCSKAEDEKLRSEEVMAAKQEELEKVFRLGSQEFVNVNFKEMFLFSEQFGLICLYLTMKSRVWGRNMDFWPGSARINFYWKWSILIID